MYTRRRHRHNLDSVAIGRYAGEESVTENTVSVGRKAGYSLQAQWAIAIGDHAGEETQGLNAISIGVAAGQTSQSTFGIAIGDQAGRTTQGANAIAIGSHAGQTTQSTFGIAIGENAGQTTQGENSIAIGGNAGQTSQGANAIAIGNNAGVTSQPEYSIIISTNDVEIAAKKKGLYIDPIRKFDDREGRPDTVKEGNVLSYNYQNDTENATKEVVTGFPRLPVYPNDAEVLLAFTEAKKDSPPPILGPLDKGTMYFDSTKKKIKVYDGIKWTALADEEDIAKLMAALASAKAGVGGAAGAAMAGASGTVIGAAFGSTQFVTGGGTSNPVMIPGPDGTPILAVDGKDFYWSRDSQPIFFKDLEVVSEKVPVHANNDPRLPGTYVTTYSNGYQAIEPIPVAVYNPALDAYNNLSTDERRAVLEQYKEASGAQFMVGPVADNEMNAPEAFDGIPFRTYLESQGLG